MSWKCLKIKIRVCNFMRKIWILYSDSWGLDDCFWLGIVQWCLRKLMRWESCFESTCKDDFSFEFFRQKFQIWFPIFSAAACVWTLGLCLGFCTECIRSRNLLKISCNHGLKIWFFHHDFHIFFHVFLVQIISNCSNSFHIDLCTKSWE